MKRVIILIPVFNDWDSLIKLLSEINKNIDNLKNFVFDCFIVNDASTMKQPKIKKPSFINLLKILNMKRNQGHGRCNAFGIKYIKENESFDYLILMDGDGEDRPIEIKSLINQINIDPNNSVVAKRVKRAEGFFFQLLYQIHKLITFVFTGRKIDFGNYSCLTKKDVFSLSKEKSLWSSYSGTVKKKIQYFNEVNSIRGPRYFGPSQMSIFKLLIHSFSIIAVFKYSVFFRCTILIILFKYFESNLGIISTVSQFLLGFFCLLIFIVSLRENEKGFVNSQNNLKNFKDLSQ